MSTQYYEQALEKRDIKPTANRLLILKTMIQSGQALSLADLERILDTVDKSSIFRVITLFLSHQLVHSIDDGSGCMKYAVCNDSCSCSVDELHSHFYCESCEKTTCMDNIHIPVVDVPNGYILKSINYVLKGICADCANKKGYNKTL